MNDETLDSAGSGALYVGVGVGTYADAAFSALDQAVPDVEEIGKAFAALGLAVHCVPNPKSSIEADLQRDRLKPKGLDGGRLVFYWAGHGRPVPAGLQLVVSDTDGALKASITAAGIAEVVAATGASQILLLIDACFAGQGDLDAVEVVDAVQASVPLHGRRRWFGVASSARPLEKARDGVFAGKLLKLLTDGPTDPYLRLRWSAHNAGLRGDDLVDALVKEWDTPGQHLSPLLRGDPWMLCAKPASPGRRPCGRGRGALAPRRPRYRAG
jgi:Caspase domain